MLEKIKVAIVGSTGYTGVKLIELLLDHPLVEIVAVTSEQYSGQAFSEVYPAFLDIFDQKCIKLEELAAKSEAENIKLIFFATPNGIAMERAHAFITRGIDIIDLSADFRLKDLETHFKYYQLERNQDSVDLNNEAIYGLCEANASKIRAAKASIAEGVLIANPGCYPTASSLSILAFLDFNKRSKNNNLTELFNLQDIIIDAKSGASGAGRKSTTANLFCEVNESFKAYNLAHKHRHNPELEEFFSIYSETKINLTFSPHLLPMTSGILATSYFSLNKAALSEFDLDDKAEDINNKLREIVTEFYKDSHFVKVLKPGQYPNTASVKGTNNVHIQVEYDEYTNKIIVCTVIDNTVKGASGQAIQNMNLLYGFDENLGLNQKVRVI